MKVLVVSGVLMFLCVGLACGAEFRPINFKGFGYDEPSLSFVVGGKGAEKVVNESSVLAVVRFSEDRRDLAPGLSVTIQGWVVTTASIVDENLASDALTVLKDPLNYGEGKGEFMNLAKQPKFNMALEATNAD